jgi:fructose/tagatose bisphosphate aldolase
MLTLRESCAFLPGLFGLACCPGTIAKRGRALRAWPRDSIRVQMAYPSAHAASVPIAVHLDHATTAEALELAIGCAEKHGVKFDSIMVDASHADVRCYILQSPFTPSAF